MTARFLVGRRTCSVKVASMAFHESYEQKRAVIDRAYNLPASALAADFKRDDGHIVLGAFALRPRLYAL